MNALRALTLVTLGSLLLAGCAGRDAPAPSAKAPAAKGSYVRPLNDGAPWWDVDVSQIPDAVPTPHHGPFKASPYTVLGQSYFPIQDARNYRVEGTASWYGTKFHGQATANGETYDLYGMTAAHKTLPLPSYVRVTSLENGRSIIVRVNDRGPFYSDRVIDLSFAAAKKLGFAERGTARVRIEGIDPQRWIAGQGAAQPVAAATVMAQPSAATFERYTPPPTQHAGALSAAELGQQTAAPVASGLYLQLGAFANPDAAELLRARVQGTVGTQAFISPIARGEQVLHRVRLGPLGSEAEARRLQDTLRTASLGQPTLVQAD
ncbi:septal ring lytic transglycosylase RlpA family protein [Pseudomonas sp. NW5]|uniref:septal ring lytic transglycosylase RlpA family protein n=1 Tax=Pseudomonas sp. NW5 TaxID=2934934 RepID=UPI00202030FC|nr:septal ring lytic transglycosylase RlpA family protein [Pseudomonas sp. NW5]MCL7461152.1 septal ring lytic transglycosylase RlpA family protein [Pseudomonas sp. NW5]